MKVFCFLIIGIINSVLYSQENGLQNTHFEATNNGYLTFEEVDRMVSFSNCKSYDKNKQASLNCLKNYVQKEFFKKIEKLKIENEIPEHQNGTDVWIKFDENGIISDINAVSGSSKEFREMVEYIFNEILKNIFFSPAEKGGYNVKMKIHFSIYKIE